MRSESMAWLFSAAGIEIRVLEGGYKQYRNYILARLSEKRSTIILGGLTGSSKTHILNRLAEKGKQIIDLEAIACHKGSAFGALGQAPQPSSEHFSNLLFEKWNRLMPDQPVWLEDESKNIGSVFLPDNFYINMQNSHVIVLMMDIETRLPRLMREYSIYPPELLHNSILRISKRLGSDNTSAALKAIENNDFRSAIEISLLYYDKAYKHGLKKKDPSRVVFVESDTDDIEANALKVSEAAETFKSV